MLWHAAYVPDKQAITKLLPRPVDNTQGKSRTGSYTSA